MRDTKEFMVSSSPSVSVSHPPRRRVRNLLLDPKFQLKYTGMVIGVTLLVSTVLGFIAYDYSKGQTQAQSAAMALQPDLDPELARDLDAWARKQDQKVLAYIMGGIGLLTLVIGVTGIMVTHRVVGPAYKLQKLIRGVGKGSLILRGGIRKGDELQDVFAEFERMVDKLHRSRTEELAQVSAVISKAKDLKDPDLVRQLESLHEAIRGQLE